MGEYNICRSVVAPMKYREHSEKTKAKMRETHKKRGSADHIIGYWTGKSLTEEHKKYVSIGRTGVKLSKQAHINLSKAAKKREFDKKVKAGKVSQPSLF